MAGDHIGLYLFGGLAAIGVFSKFSSWAVGRSRKKTARPRKDIIGRQEVNTALTALHAYVFPQLVHDVFEHGHPELTQTQSELAFQGLREFFMLLWLDDYRTQRQSIGMPSVLVDEAWHAFVLCTEEYQSFCQRFFGRMMHHRPDPSAQPDTMHASSAFSAATMRAWETFRGAQRHYPDFFRLTTAGYPLLFETDRIAGLALGWIWTEAALSELDRQLGRATSTHAMSYSTSVSNGCTSSSAAGSHSDHHHHPVGGHSGSSLDQSGGSNCSSGSSCGSGCGGGSSTGD